MYIMGLFLDVGRTFGIECMDVELFSCELMKLMLRALGNCPWC